MSHWNNYRKLFPELKFWEDESPVVKDVNGKIIVEARAKASACRVRKAALNLRAQLRGGFNAR